MIGDWLVGGVIIGLLSLLFFYVGTTFYKIWFYLLLSFISFE